MPYYGYGYGYGIDPLYLLVVLVSTVIGLAAQAYIKSTYGTWSNVKSDGVTGAEAARRMLDANGCQNVGIKSMAVPLPITTTPPITTSIFRAIISTAGRSRALPSRATRQVTPLNTSRAMR